MPPRLGKPITLPPPPRTPLHRIHRTLGLLEAGTDTHAHSNPHANRELQGMVKLRRETEFSVFTATVGRIYIFILFYFFVKRQSGNARKSMVESLTNVTAVKHECYLLLPEMFYVRLSMMVLIARSLKTLRLALFIPQLREPYAAEPH